MGTRTISTKLAIEGEAEYKKSITSCASELSTLKSHLALVKSEFSENANSMEALSAKGDALSSIYDKQKEKVSHLEDALKNAQSAQEKYSERVSAAKENIERCEKSLGELKDSTEDSAEEQAALTEELNKWKSELSEAEQYQESAERGVNNWQKQLNYANVELNDLSGEIDANNRYLEEAKGTADNCATSIDQYGKEVKSAAEESDTFGEKSHTAFEGLASALAAAGIVASLKEIADGLRACVESASAFESAFAKVSTIADTSDISLEELSAQILELSSSTGKSVSDLSEATYQAISASVDTADSVQFVAQANELATGGFTDAATAVDVLTTALNAYGLETSEASQISDILITTQNLGKTSVDELASSVGKVIPLASSYGVEMDNLGAAYAVLTANGVATAESGTYLKSMLKELGDSGSSVSKVLQEQTGMSFAGLMASGSSLGDVLGVLGSSVDGDATKFNELWSSTEAGIGALSIFNTGADGFNATLSEMQNSTGATSKAYETMAGTAEFSQQRMETALDNLKIAIGDQLSPAMQKLQDAGTDAFSWAADFVEQNPWIVGAVTALVTGLGVLAIGVTAVASASQIAAAAQTIWNAVMAANPIGLVMVGVTALAAAITALAFVLGGADEETREFTDSLKESKDAYDELSEKIEEEQTSTKNLTASLLGLLDVENKSAAQKAGISKMVETLNEQLPELGLQYDSVSDSINMTSEQLEGLVEASRKQEEYENQVSRLSELYAEQKDIEEMLAEKQAELSEEQEKGSWWTGDLENSVKDLTTAQEENAAQIAELEAASEEYAEWQQESNVATAEMQTTVSSLTAEMEELQTAYEQASEKAYNSIDSQLGLFQKLDGTAKVSIDSLITSLDSQISYMDDYAANIQKAMELGVDEGLVQKLSDGSEESAQILASIVQGGETDIQSLNDKLAKVEEGKKNFSDIVGKMATDFDSKMSALEQRVEDAAENMNVSIEAAASGTYTIQGYIDGAESMREDLISEFESLAESANYAWKSTLKQNSPSKVFFDNGAGTVEGAVLGVESKENELVSAIEKLGKSASEAALKSMPSTFQEPKAHSEYGILANAIQSLNHTGITVKKVEIYAESANAEEIYRTFKRELARDVEKEVRGSGRHPQLSGI